MELRTLRVRQDITDERTGHAFCVRVGRPYVRTIKTLLYEGDQGSEGDDILLSLINVSIDVAAAHELKQ